MAKSEINSENEKDENQYNIAHTALFKKTKQKLEVVYIMRGQPDECTVGLKCLW